MTQTDEKLIAMARRLADSHERDGEKRTASMLRDLAARLVFLSSRRQDAPTT